MGLIVCHDCELEIGESTAVCPHCGAVQSEQSRRYGAKRRRQIIVHGSTAVLCCVLSVLLAGLVSRWFGASDEVMGVAVIASGVVGFGTGSVLGYWAAERLTKE